jgi:alkylated DNA repair dioxygenase AlkB
MAKAQRQPDLFAAAPAMPAGFVYREGVLAPDEERRFADRFAGLPFAPFEFHGFLGKRRVVSFGWRYDYGARRLQEALPLPDWLTPLRRQAADVAGLPVDHLRQVLITEYSPGSAIGWHRDKPQYDEVVAFSFLSTCHLRFRRALAEGWERRSLAVMPRSAYVLRGEARNQWEHSIPAVGALRYSVTFRSLRT